MLMIYLFNKIRKFKLKKQKVKQKYYTKNAIQKRLAKKDYVDLLNKVNYNV